MKSRNIDVLQEINLRNLLTKLLVEDKIDINGDVFINSFGEIVDELNKLHKSKDQDQKLIMEMIEKGKISSNIIAESFAEDSYTGYSSTRFYRFLKEKHP